MSFVLLKLYLQVQFAIALSYLLFKFGERWLLFRAEPVRFRPLLRWARFLILLSIVAPVGMAWLPSPHLPAFPEALLRPLAEVTDALSPMAESDLRPIRLSPVRVAMDETWYASLRSKLRAAANPSIVPSGILVLLLALLVWSASRLMKNFSLLGRTLGDATEIKRIRRLSLVTSDEISIPFSARCRGRSWVALPIAEVGSSDLRLIVQHELQHHRQGDTAWAIGLEVLTVIFAPNPFIYGWKKTISSLQEFSCDESLIGRKGISPRDYASCLVRVAEAALGKRPMLVGTSCMASGSENPTQFKSFLRRRILMLAQHKKNRSTVGATALVGTAIAFSAVAICYGSQQLWNADPPTPTLNPGQAQFDPEVQSIANRAIRQIIGDHEGAYAFAVVADPNTGRILAVANRDNRPVAHTNPHWALSRRSEPASVIKSITVAAAIEKGTTTINEMHNCENGQFVIDGKVFQDWTPFDHLTTSEAVVQSSNICTAKVAIKLGAGNLAQALHDFGFGPGGTAKDFPEAVSGSIPSMDHMSDAYYSTAVGVGFSNLYTTPIEIVQAYGAIANGGTLLAPQSRPGQAALSLRRVISEETARELRQTLADVMVHGTARLSQGKIYHLAGKTGTAWTSDSGEDSTLLGSFAGFGPAEHPRLVVYVQVKDPTVKTGMAGSYVAPVFRQITEEVLQRMQVPVPDGI